MEFQEFEYEFSWTDNTRWMMPADEKLYQGEFNTLDRIVEAGIALMPDRKGICIQAGACVGLYPIRYAQVFEQVITFEPLPITHSCVIENIRRCDLTNITVYNTAIGPKGTKFKMRYPKNPRLGQSNGAHCIDESSSGTEVISIDDLPLNGKRVDHIQLDVEGYELRCLQSGEEVIKKFRPSIVLEQRPLQQMTNYGVGPKDAENWLIERGYYRAGRARDIHMMPK